MQLLVDISVFYYIFTLKLKGKTCFLSAVLQATFLSPWWVASGLIAICRTVFKFSVVTRLQYIFKHCARPCGRYCSSMCPRLSAFVLVQSSGEQRQAEPVYSSQHHRLAVDLRGQATTLLLLERCRPERPLWLIPAGSGIQGGRVGGLKSSADSTADCGWDWGFWVTDWQMGGWSLM